MDPEPAPDAGSVTPEPSAASQRPRRGRRGRRGGRGRGRHSAETPAQQPPSSPDEAAHSEQPRAEALPGAPATGVAPPEVVEQLPDQAGRQAAAPGEEEFRSARRERGPARGTPVQHEPPPPPRPPREFRPATPLAVTQAIEEVNQIIETLRTTLTEMEDVLETLELAERQKIADEQEIETLRRSLRQLHRPRDVGQPHSRH